MTLSRRAFTLGGAALTASSLSAASPPPRIRTGLDRLVTGEGADHRGRKVALLTHAGAIDAQGRRSVDAVAGVAGLQLVSLLSPEHGLSGSVAAGVHVADGRDAATGLPITSLYGANEEPPKALFEQIDTVLIDLQDIGLRPFTYAATMRDTIIAAARYGAAVMVLDRPNPLGGLRIDGPLVGPGLQSKVGGVQVAFRHGLTVGELALLIKHVEKLDLPLSVLPMDGWHRRMGIEVFGPGALTFTPPSPNLRSPRAILAYAATVLIEGTNLSEGRGTSRPFETVGAPWCDGRALAQAMRALDLPGVHFAPLRFTPSTSKHRGKSCSGVRFEVMDQQAYDPLLTGLSLIAAARALHPRHFRFLEVARPFFDLLIGQAWVREALTVGDAPVAIAKRWGDDVRLMRGLGQRVWLYD